MDISFILPIYELNDSTASFVRSFLLNLSSISPVSSLIVVYKFSSTNFTIVHPQLYLIQQSSLHYRIFGAVNQAVRLCPNKFSYVFGIDDSIDLVRLSNLYKNHIIYCNNADIILFCKGLFVALLDKYKLFFRFREHCQQHTIYSTSYLIANPFVEAFDINADHISHLFSIRNSSSYLLVPGQFARVGPHGVSSRERNFGYLSSIFALRRFYAGFIPSLYFQFISFLRRLYKRDSVLSSLKPSICVLFSSCNYELLIKSLDNFLNSLSKLPHTFSCRIDSISVVLDQRSFSPENIASLKANYPSFNFFCFTASNPKSVRTDIRNFGVQCLNLDTNSNTSILFFDGDIIVSRNLLTDYITQSIFSPLVLGHTFYLSSARTASSSPHFSPTFAELFSGFIIGFRRLAFSFLFYLPIRPLLPSYAPTLGAGNFLIHYSLFKSSGGFISLLDGWGGEDVYLGYRLYKMGFLPAVIKPFNTAYHLYHNTLSDTQILTRNKLVRDLLNSKG